MEAAKPVSLGFFEQSKTYSDMLSESVADSGT